MKVVSQVASQLNYLVCGCVLLQTYRALFVMLGLNFVKSLLLKGLENPQIGHLPNDVARWYPFFGVFSPCQEVKEAENDHKEKAHNYERIVDYQDHEHDVVEL